MHHCCNNALFGFDWRQYDRLHVRNPIRYSRRLERILARLHRLEFSAAPSPSATLSMPRLIDAGL